MDIIFKRGYSLIACEESIAGIVRLGQKTLHSAHGFLGKEGPMELTAAHQLSLLLIDVLQLRSRHDGLSVIGVCREGEGSRRLESLSVKRGG